MWLASYWTGVISIGKTHKARALGTDLRQRDKQAQFYSAADLIKTLIQEQSSNQLRRLVHRLQFVETVVGDELSYDPFPKSGSVFLFHLIANCILVSLNYTSLLNS